MKLDLYLVIGLTKESRHWSPEFLDALKSKLNPNSIQMIDLPGSGKLLKQSSPKKMEEIVNQARSQVVFNHKHQRVMIAISLGGMSAWSWTTQYPDDFTHLVLINSSLGKLSPVWKRVQPKAMLQFFKIAAASKGAKKESKVLELSANNRKNADRIYPSWVKIGEEATMSLGNILSQLVAGMKFKPVHTPKIPMLVIAAKHDKLAHFSCSEQIVKHASKTTSVKHVLHDDPNVGHGFHVDAPEILADEIAKWCSSAK